MSVPIRVSQLTQITPNLSGDQILLKYNTLVTELNDDK